MGNRESRSTRFDDVQSAVYAVCIDHNLTTTGLVRRDVDADAWIVPVWDRRIDATGRLELLHSPRSQRVRRKRDLTGLRFAPYLFYCVRGSVHCFYYRSRDDALQYLERRRLAWGGEREAAFRPVMRQVLLAVRDLNLERLCHQRLDWNVVQVEERDDATIDARIGRLEWVVPERKASVRRLATTEHLPPEALRFPKPWSSPSLEKAQLWVLASQLLALLIGKYVGGPTFARPEPDTGTRQVLRHIRDNVGRLKTMLAATSLSADMQRFLTEALVPDPEQRSNLEKALAHFWNDRSAVEERGRTAHRRSVGEPASAYDVTVVLDTDDDPSPSAPPAVEDDVARAVPSPPNSSTPAWIIPIKITIRITSRSEGRRATREVYRTEIGTACVVSDGFAPGSRRRRSFHHSSSRPVGDPSMGNHGHAAASLNGRSDLGDYSSLGKRPKWIVRKISEHRRKPDAVDPRANATLKPSTAATGMSPSERSLLWPSAPPAMPFVSKTRIADPGGRLSSPHSRRTDGPQPLPELAVYHSLSGP